ncbi:MAG: folylpolyglutamate synthase/dihydrofolate synthase family protein [Syntrophomonas sp.]
MQILSSPGILPGLERIQKLLQEMGNPHEGQRYVHIAGTNGKGSTAFMISAILKQAGCRVGRFISPHIHSYRERFTINDAPIEEQLLLNYINLMEEKIMALQEQGFTSAPTEFEILTAIALQYFNDSQADIAVMEVGMGGLYDSTNVITPLVAVITGIDYDHSFFLGGTLEEIAANKAGIIKHKVPTVAGPMDNRALKVIENQAAEKESPLCHSSRVQVTSKSQPGIQGRYLDIKTSSFTMKDFFFPLLGEYQIQNLATVLTAVMVLKDNGIYINEEYFRTALSTLIIPGRLEITRHNPPVVLDAAHNPQAAEALANSLKELFPARKKVLLCGVLDDKDAQNILSPLTEETRAFIFTKPEGSRNKHWQRLESICRNLCPGREIYSEEDIYNAVEKGLNLIREDEFLLITGSYYVLDRARRYLTKD